MRQGAYQNFTVKLLGSLLTLSEKRGNLAVTIIPAQKNNDVNRCELFTTGFATDMSEI